MTSPRTSQRNRHACARTIATLQQQDGGYALLWKRYDTTKKKQVQSTTVLLKMQNTSATATVHSQTELVADVYECNVAVADVFYIFNSTVVD